MQDTVTLEETIGLLRSDPDYYALRLGNTILGGGGFETRLYKDLRVQSGLVYFVDSSLDAGRTRSTFGVKFGSDPQNVSRARAIVERDVSSMASSVVTPAELQFAQARLLRDITLAESSETAIAGGLAGRALSGLALDEPTRAAKQSLATTAEQIRAAFAKWIDPGRFVQVTEGPKPM